MSLNRSATDDVLFGSGNASVIVVRIEDVDSGHMDLAAVMRRHHSSRYGGCSSL